MRVLQVNAVYKTRSTGRIAMEMHKFFQSRGIDSYVAYASVNTDESHDPNVFKIGNDLDHKLHALAYRFDHMQGCHSSFATKQLLRRIKELKPDIVLTHNMHSNYLNVPLFLLGLRELNIRVVMALHDCWHFTGGCYHYTAMGCDGWLKECQGCKALGKAAHKKYAILREVYQRTQPEIVATSKWIEKEARRSLLGEYCGIQMIYDWIDQNTFYPKDRGIAREKYNIGDRTLILGVATGWSPDKGQNEMVQVANAMPEARIILVGNQAEKAEYPDNVILIPFTDSKDALAELYSAADVFFNPSKQETFGLVSGEALSCGTPIVVYNTTACPEFVNRYTGEIMSDSSDAYSAIKKVIDKSRTMGRERIQEECVAFVKENFSMETNLDKYIRLFERVIQYGGKQI